MHVVLLCQNFLRNPPYIPAVLASYLNIEKPGLIGVWFGFVGLLKGVWLFFVNDLSRSSPSCLKNTSSRKVWNKFSLVQILLKILHIFLLESTALEIFLFVSWATPYQYLIIKTIIVHYNSNCGGVNALIVMLPASFHFNIPFLSLLKFVRSNLLHYPSIITEIGSFFQIL